MVILIMCIHIREILLWCAYVDTRFPLHSLSFGSSKLHIKLVVNKNIFVRKYNNQGYNNQGSLVILGGGHYEMMILIDYAYKYLSYSCVLTHTSFIRLSLMNHLIHLERTIERTIESVWISLIQTKIIKTEDCTYPFVYALTRWLNDSFNEEQIMTAVMLWNLCSRAQTIRPCMKWKWFIAHWTETDYLCTAKGGGLEENEVQEEWRKITIHVNKDDNTFIQLDRIAIPVLLSGGFVGGGHKFSHVQ